MNKSIFKAVGVGAITVMAGVAFAADSDTAYVPFAVNVDAVITAVQENKPTVTLEVTEGVEGILKLPLGGQTSVRHTDGAQNRRNAPMITGSRGNITLRLPAQPYQNAEIALYSVNGKRVLRGKADAAQTASAISRRNVAAGVYMLSVKGINGSAFTSRLTHNGGKMNISVAFGDENVSQKQRLAKSAAAGDWTITVSAAGYVDSVYVLNPASGTNPTQVITLLSSEPNIKSSCYWPEGEDGPTCVAIGGADCTEGKTCTETECKAGFGWVIENCDNLPVVQYCYWNGGCSPLVNPDDWNPDHPDLTNWQHCVQYSLAETSFGSKQLCQDWKTGHTTRYCYYGFGKCYERIGIQTSINPVVWESCDEYSKESAYSDCDDVIPLGSFDYWTGRGAYCDYGQPTQYGDGGCYYKKDAYKGNPYLSGKCGIDDNDLEWANYVTEAECIASNKQNPCIVNATSPGEDPRPEKCNTYTGK